MSGRPETGRDPADEGEDRLARAMRFVAYALAVVVALVGAGHLAAWLCGYMTRLGFSIVTMKTNTSLCLLLAGTALFLLAPRRAAPARLWAGRAMAAAVAVAGLLTLSENVFGWDLGIDQLIANEPPGALGVNAANRMGVPASMSFILAGSSLLVIAGARGRWKLAAQGFALAVCLISLLGTIGFLYGATSLHTIASLTGIAWPTAAALLMLGLGLLLARPTDGLMAQVTARDAGGASLRRWLPVLLLPVLLGYLRITGERAGLFDAATGTAITMIIFIISLAALSYIGARPLSHSSFESTTAAEFLKIINESADRRSLVLAAVQFIRRRSGCEAVGIRLKKGDDYPYHEAHGFPEEFLQLENSLCVRDPDGSVQRDNAGNPRIACMCGNVIRGRFDPAKPFFTSHGSFWTNCTTRLLATTTEADRQSGTRNRCNGQGYESVALVPLRFGRESFGLIQMNDKRQGMFTPRLIAMWERLAGYLAVALARLRAEEALRESEAKLKAVRAAAAERQRFMDVLDTLPVIIHIIRLDHRIVWANRAYRDALGDNVGKLCYASRFGRDKPCDECQAFVPLKTGKPHNWEWTLPNGRTFDIHNFPFADVDGSPVVLEMDIDITVRRAAETEMRRASQYARTLIETSLDPLVTIGPDGRITDVNAATEMATGRRRDELIGTDFSDYFTEPDKARAGYQQVFREGTVRDYALEVRHRDGHGTPVLYNAALYRDEAGKVVGIFAAARDVTELMKAQRALQEANENLERRVAERTAELARSNADLEQFAYAASHDLQEPLRMVNSFLKLLEKQYGPQLDDKAHEFIGFAVEGATRMSHLIRDLLEYSRVDRKGRKPEPTDSEKALGDALANLGSVIEESSAAVTHDALPTVMADPTQLMQLFQNLVGNAVKFRSPDRPCKVHIAAAKKDGKWEFSIADNGIGIDAAQRERIFEVFQRLHTRDKYPGTGIGLAICKKIVERHGGKIWVESRPGEGSSFRFTLHGA
ncbi:MAG: ATP-binding protein [Phycisphaerae bacterium]